MKKITTLVAAACFCLTTSALAEDVKDEAIKSLETAKGFVEKSNYNKAIEEINYALAKLNELAAEGLLSFVPDPPAGYELVDKSSEGIGQGVAVIGNAGAKGSYSGKDGGSLELNIVIGGMAGQMGSLAAFGAMFAGAGQNAGMKTIRIQGYTGTLQYDQQNRSGNLMIQVGDKTSVQIEGSDIGSADDMQKLAEKMDLAALDQAY